MQVNQVRAGAILSYVSMAVSTILSLVYAPIMKGQLGTSEYGVYGSVGPIMMGAYTSERMVLTAMET